MLFKSNSDAGAKWRKEGKCVCVAHPHTPHMRKETDNEASSQEICVMLNIKHLKQNSLPAPWAAQFPTLLWRATGQVRLGKWGRGRCHWWSKSSAENQSWSPASLHCRVIPWELGAVICTGFACSWEMGAASNSKNKLCSLHPYFWPLATEPQTNHRALVWVQSPLLGRHIQNELALRFQILANSQCKF